MTQVVYGQKGYLGSSMSVRAAEAYEQGEMPISRWTKTAIIQVLAKKFAAAKKTSLSSKSKRCVAMANTLDGFSKGLSSRSESIR